MCSDFTVAWNCTEVACCAVVGFFMWRRDFPHVDCKMSGCPWFFKTCRAKAKGWSTRNAQSSVFQSDFHIVIEIVHVSSSTMAGCFPACVFTFFSPNCTNVAFMITGRWDISLQGTCTISCGSPHWSWCSPTTVIASSSEEMVCPSLTHCLALSSVSKTTPVLLARISGICGSGWSDCDRKKPASIWYSAGLICTATRFRCWWAAIFAVAAAFFTTFCGGSSWQSEHSCMRASKRCFPGGSCVTQVHNCIMHHCIVETCVERWVNGNCLGRHMKEVLQRLRGMHPSTITPWKGLQNMQSFWAVFMDGTHKCVSINYPSNIIGSHVTVCIPQIPQQDFLLRQIGQPYLAEKFHWWVNGFIFEARKSTIEEHGGTGSFNLHMLRSEKILFQRIMLQVGHQKIGSFWDQFMSWHSVTVKFFQQIDHLCRNVIHGFAGLYWYTPLYNRQTTCRLEPNAPGVVSVFKPPSLTRELTQMQRMQRSWL